jgi:hypothetical protein
MQLDEGRRIFEYDANNPAYELDKGKFQGVVNTRRRCSLMRVRDIKLMGYFVIIILNKSTVGWPQRF